MQASTRADRPVRLARTVELPHVPVAAVARSGSRARSWPSDPTDQYSVCPLDRRRPAGRTRRSHRFDACSPRAGSADYVSMVPLSLSSTWPTRRACDGVVLEADVAPQSPRRRSRARLGRAGEDLGASFSTSRRRCGLTQPSRPPVAVAPAGAPRVPSVPPRLEDGVVPEDGHSEGCARRGCPRRHGNRPGMCPNLVEEDARDVLGHEALAHQSIQPSVASRSPSSLPRPCRMHVVTTDSRST